MGVTEFADAPYSVAVWLSGFSKLPFSKEYIYLGRGRGRAGCSGGGN